MTFTPGHILVPWQLIGPLDGGFGTRKKSILEFNQTGAFVGQYDIDLTFEQTGPNTDWGGEPLAVRFYDGAIYTLWRRDPFVATPGDWARLWRIDEDGTVTLLHEFIGYTDHRTQFESLTFDSAGNIYVVLERRAVPRDPVIYKLDSTGTLLWTKQVSAQAEYPGANSVGASWLLDDDETMLISIDFDDGITGVMQADITASDPITPTIYWKVNTPYDPSFGYFFSSYQILVSNGNVYLTEENANSNPTDPIDSTVAVGMTPLSYLQSGFINSGDYLDGGSGIDCYEEAIWVSSQVDDAAVNLYKFDSITGTLLTTLNLAAARLDGGPPSELLDGIHFALIGGAGGYGAGCTPLFPGLSKYLQTDASEEFFTITVP